ncbi:unnamed protein product [Choristocarpus tenellus]
MRCRAVCTAFLGLGTADAFVSPLSRSVFSVKQHASVRSSTRGIEMVYGKVFVAGGTKGVGRVIIDKLLGQGSEVVALVRKEEAKTELEAIKGVTAVVADALDLKAVEGAIDGCDAAITTLGGGEGSERVDYTGNRNVIESAGILGVTRLVMVTSVGCGSSREAISDEVYKVLEDALVAKTKAENMLLKYYTNSEWTIIRPGGLITADATGNAVLTEDTKGAGVIHRADVADLAVKALESQQTVRKILTAVDPSIKNQYTSDATIESFVL